MPDTKITALTAIGANPIIPSTFPIPMVDLTDTSMAASGTTKKVTVNQILGAGGTATLASATITGDLTVDTSTLKVDSANNRVGINTATPVAGVALQVCDNVFGPSLSSGIRFGNSGNNYYYDQLIVTDGSSNPAYQLNFATHTLAKYLYGGGGNKWEWYANNTLAMTLDSTGLGVGSSPSYQLHVGKSQASQTAIFVDNQQNNAAASSALLLSAYGGTWNVSVPRSATFVNPLIFKFGSTEMMRLDASGNLLVGTTSNTSFSSKIALSYDSGVTNWAVGPSITTPTGFFISANVGAQGVYLANATATSWTAWSDERLKDIIEPISNAVFKVGSLRAVIGKFKNDTTNTRKPFLIAQDVLSVLPEAVDASNPDSFGVSYTDVIPLLVAAIKELTAEVNALKNA